MADWDAGDNWVDARSAEDRSAGEGGPSVLVVDDDASTRGLLAYLFHDEGFDVTEASDGAEALRALAGRAPDCMVLDLMMPNVDGHEVLRRRRESDLAPETRVVILTAKSDPEDARLCWELGADEYMNKPVDLDRLLKDVRALLRRSPDALAARRANGLAELDRLDEMEAAFRLPPRS